MIDSTPILEARNLKVERGGTTLLNVPSLIIQDGEVLSLIGPNGAGKTTLLQTLSYLLKPFQGEISFRGQRVNSSHPIFEYRRKFALVFQEPLLFDTTVYENVASGLKIRGRKREEINRRVGEELDRFGISHLGHRSARTLSGGEAQRASLARAFAIKPEILILDEPFASLDPPSREFMIEDLERILRQTRTTTIFATHDRLEALRLSGRIAVMNGGKILQIGTPEEVMNHPLDEFVASFVGVENTLHGRVTKRDGGTFTVSISNQKIEAVGEVHIGEAVALCIRPENVTLLLPSSKEVSSARNVFSGKIVKITPLGLFQKVQLHCGFPLVAYVTNHALEELSLKEGKDVKVSFKATAIHVVRKRESPAISNGVYSKFLRRPSLPEGQT
jgi:tungstate transport system ATP-binding protein